MNDIVPFVGRLLGQIFNSPVFATPTPSPLGTPTLPGSPIQITGGVNGIISILSEIGNSNIVVWIKIIAVLLTVLLLIALLVYYEKIQHIRRPRPNIKQSEQPYETVLRNYNAEWHQVQRYLQSMTESEWKLAVIEADNIFDSALIYLSLPGETMGERLMAITKAQLPSLDEVWEGHKLRNTIVHDLGRSISQGRASSAVLAFERGLRELGLLT